MNDHEFATVISYYNADNKLCYKVSIRDINEINLPLQKEPLISWVDLETPNGFIREFNKSK